MGPACWLCGKSVAIIITTFSISIIIIFISVVLALFIRVLLFIIITRSTLIHSVNMKINFSAIMLGKLTIQGSNAAHCSIYYYSCLHWSLTDVSFVLSDGWLHFWDPKELRPVSSVQHLNYHQYQTAAGQALVVDYFQLTQHWSQ